MKCSQIFFTRRLRNTDKQSHEKGVKISRVNKFVTLYELNSSVAANLRLFKPVDLDTYIKLA